MQLMGGRDGITVINDAYNASPDSMAAALKTLAQVQAPRHAHDRRARRDERARGVLGRGARPHRAARRAPRHLAARRRRPGCAPPAHHRRSTRDRGTGESAYVETADEAYDLVVSSARPGDTVLVKSSNVGGSPPPRRPTGRMVRVRALLTAGALSLAFTLFLTPLFIRLFTRLGWGQFIRDDGPQEPPRQARHAHDGRHRLHPGQPLRLLHVDAARLERAADRLGDARPVHDGRARARRLHRRLPEDAQEAEPRPRRLGEGRRPGRRRRGVRAARAAVPERRERDARPPRASRSSATSARLHGLRHGRRHHPVRRSGSASHGGARRTA